MPSFDTIIFNQAMAGTPVNPGLPEVLASLVAAQAAHETGNFTSSIFKKYNNAFGYSYVKGSRYQLADPGGIADNNQPVARYATIADSTREVVDWIYRRVKDGIFPHDLSTIRTPEQYGALLKKAGYYQDTVANYVQGLKKFFFKVIEEAGKPSGLIIMAGVAFIAWLYFRKK